MNQVIFNLYVNAKKCLADFKKEAVEYKPDEVLGEEVLNMVSAWKDIISSVESSNPEVKEYYERTKRMQESFSYQQRDFICYQIGDWYLEWQDKMWVDGKPNQHWLGTAKEQLKAMICGD